MILKDLLNDYSESNKLLDYVKCTSTVFILLQSAGSISRNTYFAAGTIGNLLNTAAGSIRKRVVLECGLY